jgi:hypothetical protein
VGIVTSGGGFVAVLAALVSALWALGFLGGFVFIWGLLVCLETATGVNF